jgi:transcriptional regulator with XRE-family HTH domain
MRKVEAAERPVGPMVDLLARLEGVSLGDVAAALGIHPNTLTEKIRGRRAFTEDEIVILARLFGVPAGRFFEDPLQLLGVARQSPVKMNRDRSMSEALSEAA